MNITILGIESSCDDTSAAIIRDEFLLSSFIANQTIHESYGGVVPELASRAHQQNIIPVVDTAIRSARVSLDEIDAIAFTRGPGLLGSLLVGTSFAKGLALSLSLPLIEVNHLQAHVLSLFIREAGVYDKQPKFPFICLLISGGHTQLILVKSYFDMSILGQTIDDAAGEAFDKCAKVMGLPYPGGPFVDKYAAGGNENAIRLNKPRIANLDYSFSGLKTSFLYHIRDMKKENEKYIEENLMDLCASLQKTIIDILMEKLLKAAIEYRIRNIAIAGGVAANSGIRSRLIEMSDKYQWDLFLPPLQYTTDNAAMIAITGYYKYLKQDFASQDIAPYARSK